MTRVDRRPQARLMKLVLIVAVAENGVIGRQGELPWRLSADLRRFKRLTMGHPIIMGRRTWESIGRPLPGRTSIVVSANAEFDPGFEEVRVAVGLDAALELARQATGDQGSAFVIGGARLYEAALPSADQLQVTRVRADVGGDVRLSKFQLSDWRMTHSEHHEADDKNQYAMDFETYERATP